MESWSLWFRSLEVTVPTLEFGSREFSLTILKRSRLLAELPGNHRFSTYFPTYVPTDFDILNIVKIDILMGFSLWNLEKKQEFAECLPSGWSWDARPSTPAQWLCYDGKGMVLGGHIYTILLLLLVVVVVVVVVVVFVWHYFGQYGRETGNRILRTKQKRVWLIDDDFPLKSVLGSTQMSGSHSDGWNLSVKSWSYDVIFHQHTHTHIYTCICRLWSTPAPHNN